MANERMTAQQRWLMTAVILGAGIVFLDSTVVGLASTSIADELPRTFLGKLEGQSYIFSFYLVTLSAFLIIAGALNDRLGRKRMFAFGLAAFGVTSVLCGLAWSMETLVLFRILQGIAGAILVPGSLSLITVSFEGEQQGRAFGIWAAASAATTILGPVVGGVLVDTFSWRMAFFVNIPLILVALYAIRHVDESREEATEPLDWVGAALAAVAVGGLSFGAIRGEQTSFEEITPFIALGLGAAALIALPIWLRTTSHPLIPLRLFRSRNFTVTNISTFVIYGALYVSLGFLPIFMRGTLGYTAAGAGVALLASDIFLVLFSTRVGRLAARHGPRRYMTTGPLVMAAGLLLLTRVPPDSAPWDLGGGGSLLPPGDYFAHIFPALVVYGIGLTIMVAPLTTALMTSIPPRHSGVASAINNAISRIGSPLVSALIFIAISASFYGVIAQQVPEAPVEQPAFREVVAPLNTIPEAEQVPADIRGVVEEVRPVADEASTDGFHLAMFVSAGLMLIGAAVNGIWISNRSTAHAVEGDPRPDRVDTIPDGVPCLPVAQPTALPRSDPT